MWFDSKDHFQSCTMGLFRSQESQDDEEDGKWGSIAAEFSQWVDVKDLVVCDSKFEHAENYIG